MADFVYLRVRTECGSSHNGIVYVLSSRSNKRTMVQVEHAMMENGVDSIRQREFHKSKGGGLKG